MKNDGRPIVLVCASSFWDNEAVCKILDEYELVRDLKIELHPTLLSKQEKRQVVAMVLSDQVVGEDIMDQLPALRLLARTGTGYDGIDAGAAKKRGITIIRCSEMNANASAEHAVGLILDLSKGITKSHGEFLFQEKWNRVPGRTLKDQTIGIIGLRTMGSRLAEKLSALGVGGLMGWNRTRRHDNEKRLQDACGMKIADTVETLIKESDIVVSCIAYDKGPNGTKHFISRKRIDMMKNGAFLVNVSRGAVVDEEYLPEAIRNGKLGGAALDVFSVEPPTNEPFYKELQTLVKEGANIVLTPHMAARTQNIDKEIATKVAHDIKKYMDGNIDGVEIVV